MCESAIWHPLEIGTIIAQGITLERMACVGVGILASAITSFIERKKKTANSAKHSNKGKYSEPRTRDTWLEKSAENNQSKNDSSPKKGGLVVF